MFIVAICNLICNPDANQSDVDTIKGWLTENGHEVVHSDISTSANENYVQIGDGYVKVKAGIVTAAFFDADDTEIGGGVSQRFRFGDEARYVEKALKFLGKHL